jgi:mannose-6-phosphate isomerase-like protein (cupin superfamily)
LRHQLIAPPAAFDRKSPTAVTHEGNTRMGHGSLIVAALFAKNGQPSFRDDFVTVTHVHHTERSSTAIAFIRAGGGLRPHFHQHHDEIIVFLAGEATFQIGNELRQVSANDVISVPAGVVHATLRAQTPCVLAATFAPYFDLINEDRVYVDT